MNVILSDIFDAGIPGQERIMFSVIDTDNLGRYMVFKTVETEQGKVRSRPDQTYWFPDINLARGDVVFLYTGPGKNGSFANRLGTITYRLYWSNLLTLFNTSNDSAVLLKIDSWTYKKRTPST